MSATTKITRFKVTGRGVFPMDMLRYDMAWPRDGDSATKLWTPEERSESRTVELQTCSSSAPTVGRWASFGWTVLTELDEYRSRA